MNLFEKATMLEQTLIPLAGVKSTLLDITMNIEEAKRHPDKIIAEAEKLHMLIYTINHIYGDLESLVNAFIRDK